MDSSDFSDSDYSWHDSDDLRKDSDFVPDSTNVGIGKNTMSSLNILSFHRLTVLGPFVSRKWGLSFSLCVCLSTLV